MRALQEVFFEYSLAWERVTARGCQQCATECAECESAGTLCKVCRGPRDSSGHCVHACPTSTYNVSVSSDRERGHCKPCHDECEQCIGPHYSDCTLCRNHKVYTSDLLSQGDSHLLADYNVTDSDEEVRKSVKSSPSHAGP